MHIRLCLLASFFLSFFSSNAAADSLSSTRSTGLKEIKHTVDVTVVDGVATYVVTRTFENPGDKADEARLDINLPAGAVATGLRIKAKSKWYDGELMHAAKAEELYQELTGLGPNKPKDPALLYWKWTDLLGLRVFPIMPKSKSVVAYTLTAPTTYKDGKYFINYDRVGTGTNLAVPKLRVRGNHLKSFSVDGRTSRGYVSLAEVPSHPILAKLGIHTPQALLKKLTVRGVDEKPQKLRFNIKASHTWPSDLRLALITPDRKRIRLSRVASNGTSKNDLAITQVVEVKGAVNGDWHLFVEDTHPWDGGTVDSWSLSTTVGQPVTFADRAPVFIPQPREGGKGVATIAISMRDTDTTKLRLGRVAHIEGAEFSRVEVDVAPALSTIPKKLSAVFLIDASHTMDQRGIEAQLRLVTTYLSIAKDASFQIIGFSRFAKPWSIFAPARDAQKIVEGIRKKGLTIPSNGSHLDRGVIAAAEALNTRVGNKALIICTDNRLRPAWQITPSIATIKSLSIDTTVHVVDVSQRGYLDFTRQDDHRLFPLAKSKGGVAVTANGILESRSLALLNEVLYLVRPNRLDHVSFEAFGDAPLDGQSFLKEGDSIRWQSKQASPPTKTELIGQLWSKKVRFPSSGDEHFNQATAGFIFSQDHYQDLTDQQQYMLGMYGKAVTPMTSYLAIEPGVRPSIIGLEAGGLGLSGSGMGGSGFGLGGGSMLPKYSWQATIQRAKKACLKGVKRSIPITVDTQRHEIVDVQGATDSVTQCVVDEFWKTQLPKSHRIPSRQYNVMVKSG